MAVATVIEAHKDANNAYLAVMVAEGGQTGNVQYIGSTPLLDATGAAKTVAQLKTDLTASCKAQRDAQLAQTSAVAISGTVNL